MFCDQQVMIHRANGGYLAWLVVNDNED